MDKEFRKEDFSSESNMTGEEKRTAESGRATEEMYGITASVGHLVDELNGLLFDIKNVTIESENNIILNLRTLNENILRLNAGSAVYVTNEGDTACDAGEIAALKAEIALIKEQGEKNRRLILDEIRKFRDHMLIISMAKVSDGEEESYETYNELLLSEIKSLKDDLGTVDPDALAAALAAAPPVVEYRPAESAPAPVKQDKPKAAHKPIKPPVKRAMPVAPRKVVTPVANNDLSINEILSKISSTDVKISKE
ncbi:MAG: hypothetical protein LBH24_04055 [Clostridiales bacterium]|jgi:hypothetical protein|nr:hypothetical protein [Clostridiales bacterium]